MLITNTRAISNYAWARLKKLSTKYSNYEAMVGIRLLTLGMNCITKDTIDEVKWRDRVLTATMWKPDDPVHSKTDHEFWEKLYEDLVGFGVNNVYEKRSAWLKRITSSTSAIKLKALSYKDNQESYDSLDWSRDETTH